MGNSSGKTPRCASCGKGGASLKTCGGCNLVEYCDATCQKDHRPHHKEECKKRAAVLLDEALFETTPPPRDDCPVCFLPLGFMNDNTYSFCCGKNLCYGCVHSVEEVHNWSPEWPCPFCRTPSSEMSDKEKINRLNKRVEANDAQAMHILAYSHSMGQLGLPQDSKKAIELWLKSASMGDVNALYWLGNSYFGGDHVKINTTRAIRYWSRASIMGDVCSRFSLGNYEAKIVGNMNRAKKHWMIAATAGHNGALEKIKHGYTSGTVTKDEYERSLRAHKDSVDEMYSEHRSKAMARHRSIDKARKEIINILRPKVRSGNREEECNCIDCMMGRNA
jgi:hypothetical protein